MAQQPRNFAPTLGNGTWKELLIQLKMEIVTVIGVLRLSLCFLLYVVIVF